MIPLCHPFMLFIAFIAVEDEGQRTICSWGLEKQAAPKRIGGGDRGRGEEGRRVALLESTMAGLGPSNTPTFLICLLVLSMGGPAHEWMRLEPPELVSASLNRGGREERVEMSPTTISPLLRCTLLVFPCPYAHDARRHSHYHVIAWQIHTYLHQPLPNPYFTRRL